MMRTSCDCRRCPVQVMLARAPHVAYTPFLCITGCMGFLPMAALRARMGPPALAINLGYAFTIVNAQFVWGVGELWTHVRAGLGLKD